MRRVAHSEKTDLRVERLELSQKNNALAVLIFAVPICGYAVSFSLILVVGWPWALPMCIASAWFIGMAFVVGHDACHHSFTSSRWLNSVLGRICFLPSLHSFSLWDLGHNRIHHRLNNVRGCDYVWEPMSLADFSAASPLRRLLYRVSRHGLGIPLYYAFAIWLPKMFLLRRRVYGEFRPAYVWDGLLVWSFSLVQVATAIWLGNLFGRLWWESILLAVVVPFLIWNALISFVVYLHHTHPSVPWYHSAEDWRSRNGRLTGTVHVRFPWVVRKLMLEIMDHNAHHFAPGVPLYHLAEMQQHLDDEQIVEWDWTIGDYIAVSKACKLYDYRAGRWVGFP